MDEDLEKRTQSTSEHAELDAQKLRAHQTASKVQLALLKAANPTPRYQRRGKSNQEISSLERVAREAVQELAGLGEHVYVALQPSLLQRESAEQLVHYAATYQKDLSLEAFDLLLLSNPVQSYKLGTSKEPFGWISVIKPNENYENQTLAGLIVPHLSELLQHAASVDRINGIARKNVDENTQTQRWVRESKIYQFDGKLKHFFTWKTADSDISGGKKLIAEKMKQAQAAGKSLSVILTDIDDFGKYNGKVDAPGYGYLQGDAALKAVADEALKHIRHPPLESTAPEFARHVLTKTDHTDFAVRYGGEEYVLVFDGMTKAKAAKRADELVQAMRQLRVPRTQLISNEDKCYSGDKTYENVTVSVGVANIEDLPHYADPMEWADALLNAADRAIHEAKARGKDCVAIYQKP